MIRNIPWLSKLNPNWELIKGKYLFRNIKQIAKNNHEDYSRLALTLNGVIERAKDDSDGLQPADYSSYQVFNKGNLVFKLIDLENKQTSRVGLVQKKGIMSPAYIRLEKINEQINEYFAYYYYLSLYFQDIYRDLGQGVRSSLSASDLLEIPVPVPSIELQSEIVNFLDNKIHQIQLIKNHMYKQIKNLKEYRFSLIFQAVTKGLDPKVPMKSSGIEWLGDVPEYWKINKASRMYKIEMGKMRQADQKSSEDIEIQYLKSTNIQWHRLDLSSVQTMWVHPDEISKVIVEEGDLIICEGGEVGRGCIIENLDRRKLVIEKSLHRVRETEMGNSYYLLYLLEAISNSKFFEVICNGATIKHLTAEKLKELKIPMPSYEEQKQIVDFLEQKFKNLQKLIDKIEQYIHNLDEYKSSLIIATVTGQIDMTYEVPSELESYVEFYEKMMN